MALSALVVGNRLAPWLSPSAKSHCVVQHQTLRSAQSTWKVHPEEKLHVFEIQGSSSTTCSSYQTQFDSSRERCAGNTYSVQT